jgi:hypothetical protein
MKSLMRSIALAVMLAVQLSASGPIGIYGIVEKIVFEPNEQAPVRIQVWGVFARVDGNTNYAVSPAGRGYLYLTLPAPPAQVESAKREWADLKAISGTGQAVGFGSALDSGLRVRPASEAPASPTTY